MLDGSDGRRPRKRSGPAGRRTGTDRPRSFASITRSLNGFAQQTRTVFRAISGGRMPPSCARSTAPESRVVLQVPHIPCPHDDGGVRPAATARTFSSAAQVTVRPLRWTVVVDPLAGLDVQHDELVADGEVGPARLEEDG